MLCFTQMALTLIAGFTKWLSDHKEKVYPTKEDFLRKPETFPNFLEASKNA